MATQVVPNTARPLGRQLGRRGTCRSSVSLGLRRRTVPSTRRVPSFVISPVALDRNRDGGIGGDDGELNTNVLYERMKALQEKESGENTQIVEAAIEKDQAIVAGIRGDAAERRVPEPGEFDALIEHILSTPMEAMDYEGVRCASLLTKAFSAHIDLKMRQASAMGLEGEETLAELQLLSAWVMEARERREERDDAMRRRQRQGSGGMGGVGMVDTSIDNSNHSMNQVSQQPVPDPVSYPTPLRTAGDKFRLIMSAAAQGVDVLRAEIIQMARSNEIDDALFAILTGNAANAEADGDDGRAKFLFKIAEVCERERKNAQG